VVRKSPRPGLTLVERELVDSLGWLIAVRWIAGAGVLTATWATGRVFGLQLAAGPLYAIGVSILAYNTLFYWILARVRRESLMPTVPLHGKEGPLGLICAYSDAVNHFTDDDVTFLSVIAGQGSIATENALAYQALGQLDQMKSKFVRMVTHELRSPVSVVQSLLRTLLAGYVGAMTDAQTWIVY
jgi:signal transduction histidine kinase